MTKIENPKIVFISSIVIIIIIYILFQSRFVLLGPRIKIYTPKNNEVATTSLVWVNGHAENIAYITLDDRPIFVDEKGDFSEKVIAHNGINSLKLWAKDKYGRQAEKTLRIIYNK